MKAPRSKSTTALLVIPESPSSTFSEQAAARRQRPLDDSWSSTVPIHLNDDITNKCVDSAKEEPTALHVHFDESRNRFYEDERDCNYANICDSWYSSQDYEEFDRDMDFILQSFHDFQHNLQRRGEEDPDGFVPILQDIYFLCCDALLEDHEEDLIQQLISMGDHEDDDEEQQDDDSTSNYASLGCVLGSLYQDDEFNLLLIGLERYLVDSIAQGRRERRATILRWIQEVQKENADLSCEEEWQNSDDLTQTLRQVSLEVSRPARLLAQCLAQAQMGYGEEKNNRSGAPEEEGEHFLDEDKTIDDSIDSGQEGLEYASSSPSTLFYTPSWIGLRGKCPVVIL